MGEFTAKIVGNRPGSGKVNANTQIQYISGHAGQEWIHVNYEERLLSDEWGHRDVPFEFISDGVVASSLASNSTPVTFKRAPTIQSNKSGPGLDFLAKRQKT